MIKTVEESQSALSKTCGSQCICVSFLNQKFSHSVLFLPTKASRTRSAHIFQSGLVRFGLLPLSIGYFYFFIFSIFLHTQRFRSAVTDLCVLLLLDNYTLREPTSHFFLPLSSHISVSSLPHMHSAIQNLFRTTPLPGGRHCYYQKIELTLCLSDLDMVRGQTFLSWINRG